jgi:hypothetical protein
MVRTPTVRVVDAQGLPIPGAVVRAVAGPTRETLGKDEALRNFEAITDSSGAASFRDLIFTGRPRSVQLGFKVGDAPVGGLTSMTIRSPVARRILVVAPIPSVYQVGGPVTQAPRASVLSAEGEALVGVRVTVVSLSGNAFLTGNVSETNDRGEAEFRSFTLEAPCTVGGCQQQRLVFQADAVVSDTMVVTPRPPIPTRGELSGLIPGAVTSVDEIVNGPVLVQVYGAESLSNALIAGVPVELRAHGYGIVGIGTTDDRGIAEISVKAWRPKAGSTTLGAVVGGRELASKTITITSGSASTLRVIRQPPVRILADSAFQTAPTVKAVDVAGNAVPGVEIHAKLCGRRHNEKAPDDPSCLNPRLGAELAGTLVATTNEVGEAEFKDLSFHGRDGQYYISFDASLYSTTGQPVREKSSIFDYNPDDAFDRSYVTISAIKSIAGIIPENEFFDLRFRFRVAPRMHVLASTDLSLTARNTDSVKSTQKSLTEGGVLANLEVHRRRDPVSDIPERAIYLGGQIKVFNTIPYYGAHIGNVELGGSPFHGSSATFALLYRAYRNTVIVNGDTIQPAPKNLMADFFLRSSRIDFFKVLTIRGSILMPLQKEGQLSSRLTIAIPVGQLDIF